MAKVHFDMQEKIPNIAKAKINGYPSVIKVLPNGTVEEYKDESGESTNAVPNMRDKNEMMKNLMIKPVSANNLFGKNRSNKLKRNWNTLKNANTEAEEAKEAENAEAAEEAKEAEEAEAAENAEAAKEAKEAENAEAAEVVEIEKALKNKIKNEKKNANKNINFPGIITSNDIQKVEKQLLRQRGGRRKQIQSFLKGGSLIEDLRSIGTYLKDLKK
jgi:F0F1-type ATP synthase membrane subunit b/b'